MSLRETIEKEYEKKQSRYWRTKNYRIERNALALEAEHAFRDTRPYVKLDNYKRWRKE